MMEALSNKLPKVTLIHLLKTDVDAFREAKLKETKGFLFRLCLESRDGAFGIARGLIHRSTGVCKQDSVLRKEIA